MDRPKTIFCDIDGTLMRHCGDITNQYKLNNLHGHHGELLENTIANIKQWDRLSYKIILVTGRKESTRNATEYQLSQLGIVYDELVMGITSGDRILINDRKPNSSRNTAYAYNVVRNKGLPLIDFKSNYVTVSDNQPISSQKPWGGEELIEYNDNYVFKRLYMKKGECCSLQYHELKKETVYVLSGKLKLYIGNDINSLEERVMKPGDHITINPYTIHRMEGIEDSYYLEASTNQLWDVVRLHDKYNRT